VRLYVLLDRLDRLPILLLVHHITLLLEGHLVTQLHRYVTLLLEPLPSIPVLRLPVLRCHGASYQFIRVLDNMELLKSFLSTFLR
jgi:hypothetical protein